MSKVSDKPRFVPENYLEEYKKPIIPEKEIGSVVEEYHGTGVHPDKHFLKSKIRFNRCGNCDNKDVLVIYAKWSVHMMSGDVYWDYELYCDNCGMFTTSSYAEND